MEIKRHIVEIDNDNPFSNDWLERKEFAKQLTNIIENNYKGEVVVGLSGQWGEGKTTFVKMWQKHMEQKNIACIYFDAFEYDYLEDAFLSLAIEVYNYAEQKNISTKEDYLNQSKNTYQLLQTMISKTPPINLDASFNNKLNQEGESSYEIAEIIKQTIGIAFNNSFEQALKHKKVFENFKKSLSQLAFELSNQDTPLVIIIDELDRCKPSYAIEVLEKIKHLFLVEGVVFVLSMHHEQLEEAIKKVYGQNIDAHTYLQKFIDYPTRLPKPEISSNMNRRKYFYNQLEFIGLPTTQTASMQKAYDLFVTLSILYDLSYRQLNKAMQNYKYLLSSLDSYSQESYPTMFIMTFLSILKVKNGSLIDKIRNDNFTYEDFEISGLYIKGEMDIDVEVLQDFIRYCFYTSDTFEDTQYGSREQDYFQNFSNLIDTKKNKVLRTLTQRLESFGDY